MTYTVLWNGTKDTPWGRLMFVTEAPAPVEPEAPTRRAHLHRGAAARVRLLRNELPEWFTVNEIAIKAGLSRVTANQVLAGLARQGEVARRYNLIGPRRDRIEQMYRFVR